MTPGHRLTLWALSCQVLINCGHRQPGPVQLCTPLGLWVDQSAGPVSRGNWSLGRFTETNQDECLRVVNRDDDGDCWVERQTRMLSFKWSSYCASGLDYQYLFHTKSALLELLRCLSIYLLKVKTRNEELLKQFFLSRLFAALEAEDEYYRILFIVLKTRLADIGRRIQYSLYSFNIKIKYQPQDL